MRIKATREFTREGLKRMIAEATEVVALQYGQGRNRTADTRIFSPVGVVT